LDFKRGRNGPCFPVAVGFWVLISCEISQAC